MIILNGNGMTSTIPIGYIGENEARVVQFDVSDWVTAFGPGVVSAVHQRSGDDYPYPVVLTREDNTVSWTVGSADVEYPGTGKLQLVYTVSGTVAKTQMFNTLTENSLGTTDPPDPYQTWLDTLTELAADVQQGVTDAEAAAEAAETAQGKAEDAQEASETAQEAAETAQDKAEDAQEAAETAQGKAEEAQGKAEEAQGKAEDAQDAAEDAALVSEGYAVGKQNGVDVGSDSPYYHNNAEYMKDQAGNAAQDASDAKDDAVTAKGAAEDARDAILAMTAEATIDANTGTPDVEVEKTEEDGHAVLTFKFKNLVGATGNGIHSISLLSTSGLTKTYRITFTDGNYFDYSISDGSGVSSISVSKTGTSGLVDTYTGTITYSGGSEDTFTFTVTNGYSPSASVSKAGGTSTITITDENGTTSASVTDGVDGYSPSASVSKSGSTSTISITDKNGTTTALVTDGSDGITPTVTVTEITGGHNVAFDYGTGDPRNTDFDVMDGEVSTADLVAVANSKAPVITDTASGSIASFSDGSDGMPMVEIVGQIEPVQDLHGYDNPWPAGGSKNKFVQCADGTISNVAVTWQSDGGVKLNGLCSGAANAEITATLPAGTYTLSCGYTGTLPSNTSARVQVYSASPAVNVRILNNDSQTQYYSVTLSDATSLSFRIRLDNGFNYQNVILYPQFEEGSSRTTFSPYSNICPISGWTGANVTGTGKNLFDPTNILSAVILGGTDKIVTNADWGIGYVSCKPNTAYTISKVKSARFIMAYTKELPTDGVQCYSLVTKNNDTEWTYTTGNDASYLVFVYYYGSADTLTREEILATIQVELSDTATATTYSPYSGTTLPITWQSSAVTVYGGNFVIKEDGSVKLRAEKIGRTFDGSSNTGWGKVTNYGTVTRFSYTNADIKPASVLDALTNMFKRGTIGTADLECFNIHATQHEFQIQILTSRLATDDVAGLMGFFSTTPLQIVYPLATPIEYDLTDVAILSTLLGENNVWTDTGSTEVTYRADTRKFIEKLTMPTEDDMVANQAITSGSYFMIGNSLYLALANIANGAQITIGTNAQRVSLADALNTINS